MSTSPVNATTATTNRQSADLRHTSQPRQHTADADRLLTINEVAEWFGVSKAWVYDHATRKRPFLPCVRFGELTRFRREEIEKFIQEHAKRNGTP
jgi:excisionase family DNA binding protein